MNDWGAALKDQEIKKLNVPDLNEMLRKNARLFQMMMPTNSSVNH